MRNMIRLTTLLLVLAVLLVACLPAAPTQTEQGQVQNTPVDIQAQVNTAVAQTIAAQNQVGTSVAQTLQAQITLTSTVTETPIPTITPLVLQTTTGSSSGSGSSGGGGGGGGSVKPAKTPSQYSCTIMYETPGDGTVFKPKKEFNISWTVKNTGTKTWDPTWYFEYFKGTNFSITGAYPIGKTVKPGETIMLELDAIAPGDGVTYDHPVTFVMQWAIKGDGSKFCTPYKAIIVSKQ